MQLQKWQCILLQKVVAPLEPPQLPTCAPVEVLRYGQRKRRKCEPMKKPSVASEMITQCLPQWDMRSLHDNMWHSQNRSTANCLWGLADDLDAGMVSTLQICNAMHCCILQMGAYEFTVEECSWSEQAFLVCCEIGTSLHETNNATLLCFPTFALKSYGSVEMNTRPQELRKGFSV